MKKTWVISLLTFLMTFGWAAIAFAADGKTGGTSSFAWAAALAAGLGMGLAVFGGALGQGRIGSSALDGIARNPGADKKIFTPMILALALVESLVIFAMIIQFFLLFKF